MSDSNISIKEVVKMCHRLAHKYKAGHSHFDDLVSEGVLECLEVIKKLESEGEQASDHWGTLYRRANSRMHDYLNLDLFPVQIPAILGIEELWLGVLDIEDAWRSSHLE